MKAFVITLAVFSLLCSSAGGYFLCVEHNEIQALEVKAQTSEQQETMLSASLKKDESVQKRIIKNQKTFYENQKVLADAVNKILDALSNPEPTDHRSRL